MNSSDSVEDILVESEYVTIRRGRGVVDIILPDGGRLGLTAHQASSAVIVPHGNSGRSRIRFTLEVEVQAHGDVAVNRAAIMSGLVKEIESLRDALESARGAPE